MQTLADRMKTYEKVSDYQLMTRCPVIVRLDGKNFSKATRLLEKPNYVFSTLMGHTLLATIKDIGDAVFGYVNSDEITLLLKNDYNNTSQPWFNNRIQKITSIAAAMATYHFNSLKEKDNDLKLKGMTIFDCRVFTVPTVKEAINAVIARQQDCLKNAITCAIENSLVKKGLGPAQTKQLIHCKNSKERIELLQEHCGLDFWKDFPSLFSKGIGAYKETKKLVNQKGETFYRNKWILNFDLPKFAEDCSLIENAYNNVTNQ